MPSVTGDFKISEYHKQIAVLIAAGLFFTAIGWFVAVRPVSAKIGSLRQAILEGGERSKLISEIHDLRAKLKTFEKSLSAEDNRHLLLGKITTLADQNGLDVQSLVPTSAVDENYTDLTMDLKTWASFHTLLQFLQALEQLEFNVSVTSLLLKSPSFRSLQSQPSGLLDATLTLETYLTQDKQK